MPQKNSISIGQLYFTMPSEGECYYLHMLLYMVTCLKSFEDLRTYDGITYPTYKEACMARGLLESDEE